MTELKTLIEENASLVRELKYNVKEKKRLIEMLLEQLLGENKKVFELVEALKLAAKYVAKMVADDVQTVVPPQIALDRIEAALAKVEGKE